MNLDELYVAGLADGRFAADDAQHYVVERLADLQSRLQAETSWSSRLRRRIPFVAPPRGPRGIYLWGGVGRGKTFLMDLFFGSLNITEKKRIHFHRMMRDVHTRLKAIEDEEDPLGIVADDIAAQIRVLCFDEFYVSDIGDAMILGRLLTGLFDRGVTLVATSNSSPSDLYRGGLQRERFLPAIRALETCTEVIEIGGDTDYRLQLFKEAGTYLTPLDTAAEEHLAHYFEEMASGDTRENLALEILGRDVMTRRVAKGVAWFDFVELCDGPRSQDDYIEIARWYPTVILSGVPELDRSNENAARRFIALVDEFYDRKVKLVVSAAAAPDRLYRGDRLEFEFQRTASRLTEMQTEEYLHAPHLA